MSAAFVMLTVLRAGARASIGAMSDLIVSRVPDLSGIPLSEAPATGLLRATADLALPGDGDTAVSAFNSSI